MKLGALLKRMCLGMFVFGVLAVCAGSARAEEDWQRVDDGSVAVDIYIKKDPAISNGVRNVQLKFVNHNNYDVSLTYTAIIRCPSEGSKDAATGKSRIKRHSDDTTSFTYTLCKDDATDDTSKVDVRINEVRKN